MAQAQVQPQEPHYQQQQDPNAVANNQKVVKKRRKRVKKGRKVGRWYLGETLGKGGYSWVKKGYDRQDGRVVALKFTSKAQGNWSDSQTKQVQNEIEALRQIRHKHVLQLLAYNLNTKYPQKDGSVLPSVLLVLEYLPGGELFDILYYTHALKEDIARTYFHQLMDGLTACHKAGVCHRDIKPQNLLLDSHFRLKIADFGLAKIFDKEDENVTRTFYVGTRGYQAPEILNKQPYSFACDIFSCGVVLFILLAGYPPFEAATSKCRWYAPLAAGNAREFWKQHRGCGIPSAAKDLITRMLWYDKDKRITISGIMKHKWFNAEKLGSKDLIKELKTLHRKMEVERRNDASKQDELNESIKRRNVEAITARVLGTQRPGDSIDNKEEQEDEDGFKTIYNGETIKDCGEIFKAFLKSPSKDIEIECTGIVSKQFLNSNKKEIQCDNIQSKLIELLGNKSPKLQAISEAQDSFVQIIFTNKDPECVAPLFPENDTIKFKDVFTQSAPGFALRYIEERVTELGGEATLDLEECMIKAKLMSHNFPEPVHISIRIYFSEASDCHVVRFDRISGDVLHFTRVLRQLVSQCGYVLTGLSDEQYNAMEEKQKDTENDEEIDDFADNFDINNTEFENSDVDEKSAT